MITCIHIVYIILALLGLSVLIFIHEFGHYLMARLVGMRVEVFSIGFGKAIFTWKKNGVLWQIGFIPFGGYVKIAGMDREKGKELETGPDGYFAKKPWQRLLVAFAGPFMNVLFAFLMCTILWAFGGREEPFSRFTKKIGMMDKTSFLYQKEVRPGDEITSLNQENYKDFQDMLFRSASKDKEITMTGHKMNYYDFERSPFNYTLHPYVWNLPNFPGLQTVGIFAPAKELIYHKISSPVDSFFTFKESGIHDNDRILWANGEWIFSEFRLSSLMTETTSLLTIQREGKTFVAKVQKYPLKDLKMHSLDLQEIDDWKHCAKIKDKVADLYFVPYFLNEYSIIETEVLPNTEPKVLDPRNPFEVALKPGDKIIAVDGSPVYSPAEILTELQKHKMIMVVVREKPAVVSWEMADAAWNNFSGHDVLRLISSLGGMKPLESTGNLHLLKPIELKKLENFTFNEETKKWVLSQIAATGVPTEKIDEVFNELKSKRMVDFPMNLQDTGVNYNPNPIQESKQMIQQMAKMFTALFSGNMSPKMLAGPIGMIKMMEGYFKNGVKETLYFLGFISMNLAVLNLLPIPALDGGHIIFNLIEMIRRKPIKQRTIEILSMVFFVLFFAFLIYVTYQDILRIVKGFF